MELWQSPRTRKQARPNVTTPTARAAGIAELEIVVDSHEQYAYKFGFGGQRVATVKRGWYLMDIDLDCQAGDDGLPQLRNQGLCTASTEMRRPAAPSVTR